MGRNKRQLSLLRFSVLYPSRRPPEGTEHRLQRGGLESPTVDHPRTHELNEPEAACHSLLSLWLTVGLAH